MVFFVPHPKIRAIMVFNPNNWLDSSGAWCRMLGMNALTTGERTEWERGTDPRAHELRDSMTGRRHAIRALAGTVKSN
jgi:hypothetical protein